LKYSCLRDNSEVRCPVCDGLSQFMEQAADWGQWRTCGECGLEFVNPLRLPHRPEALFDGAYRGTIRESALHDFNRNLARRPLLVKDPTLWFWTPAYREVLAWVKRCVPAGGTVLELGCGHGLFLHALRNEGFNAVGLDPAEVVVELNRRDGFRVWHGTIESVTADWVTPDAIVALFILHHLVDPLGALASVRRRWPSVPFAVAQYGPGRRAKHRSDPPRNLTRWNLNSLGMVLRRAGYRPSVSNVHGIGAGRLLARPLLFALKPTIALPPLYRFLKRVQYSALPKVLHSFKREAEVVVAFGEPDVAGP
jgi:SAM-dependent methyltransferase